ncbi:hypothetical protein EYF80_023175 [Liparis tanakae]|uniref:Uncharacterized protein n=1 Tax=Liparis tanakae TaxID=230148 RepID=A0A4Z2HM82_9TELE|nr:hypothetical protein EYF80_023175 [Liparis tanakae]
MAGEQMLELRQGVRMIPAPRYHTAGRSHSTSSSHTQPAEPGAHRLTTQHHALGSNPCRDKKLMPKTVACVMPVKPAAFPDTPGRAGHWGDTAGPNMARALGQLDSDLLLRRCTINHPVAMSPWDQRKHQCLIGMIFHFGLFLLHYSPDTHYNRLLNAPS